MPRWIPLLGGRPVDTGLAVIAASLGALAVTFLWWVLFFGGLLAAESPDPGVSAGEVLFVAAYAPSCCGARSWRW